MESDPQNAQMLLGKRYHLISTDSLKLLIATEACLFAQGHSLEIVWKRAQWISAKCMLQTAECLSPLVIWEGSIVRPV